MPTHAAGAKDDPSAINALTGAEFSATNAKVNVPVATLLTKMIINYCDNYEQGLDGIN